MFSKTTRTFGALSMLLGLVAILSACGAQPATSTVTACRESLAENPTPPEQRQYNPNQQMVGVDAMHLVTENQGWMVTGGRLYWTADQGCHWRSITPGDRLHLPSDAVFFLDSRHGWVASSSAVFRTIDGALTWQRYSIDYSADFAGLQFVDQNHGWLAIASLSHTEANLGPGGAILHTTDGGIHWTSYGGSVINSGQVRFVTPSIGWALNYDKSAVYRSDDAGDHWTTVMVPMPANYSKLQLSLPTFATSTDGALAAILRDPAGTVAFTYYATSDGGRSWTPTRLFTGVPLPVVNIVGGRTWVVAHTGLATTDGLEISRDSGRTWAQVRAVGLPAIDEIDFATPLVGWARPRGLECVGVGEKCSYREDMLLTVDGGSRWRTIDLKAAGL